MNFIHWEQKGNFKSVVKYISSYMLCVCTLRRLVSRKPHRFLINLRNDFEILPHVLFFQLRRGSGIAFYASYILEPCM